MLRVAQLIRSLSYQTWVLLSDLSGLFWQLADRNSRDLFFVIKNKDSVLEKLLIRVSLTKT